jgi:hypothetical protein
MKADQNQQASARKTRERVKLWEVAGGLHGPRAVFAKQALGVIGAQDTKALSAILKRSPKTRHANFSRRGDVHSKSEYRCPLSHVVLDTGWLEGLDVLAGAGDKFDEPWIHANESAGSNGVSALGLAVGAGSGPAVRRMLALGAEPNGRPGEPPLGTLPTEPWQHRNTKSVTRAFIEAGVDPWAKSKRMKGLPLVLGLLADARPIEALLLLRHASQFPASVDVDCVWGLWLEGIKRFRRSAQWAATKEQGYSYLDCAERLVELGAAQPSLTLVLVDMVNSPILQTDEMGLENMDGLIQEMVAQYRYEPLELEQARAAATAFEHDGARGWKAAIERALLEGGVAPALKDSRRGMRL